MPAAPIVAPQGTNVTIPNITVTSSRVIAVQLLLDIGLGVLSFTNRTSNVNYDPAFGSSTFALKVTGTASAVNAALQSLRLSVASTVTSVNPTLTVGVAELGGNTASSVIRFSISCSTSGVVSLSGVTVSFNSDLTGIVISIPTTLFVSAGSTAFTCTDVFALVSGNLGTKLGSGASCTWDSAHYRVLMLLGPGATISSSDVLVLLSGYVTACPASTTYANGSLGAISLPAATVTVSPIFGPVQVSTCGSAAPIFYSTVTGLGFGNATIVWKLNGSQITSCTSPSSCQLGASNFPSAGNYTLSLSVTNYVLQTATSPDYLITVVDNSAVSLTISGPSVYPRSSRLFVTVYPSSCNSSTSA